MESWDRFSYLGTVFFLFYLFIILFQSHVTMAAAWASWGAFLGLEVRKGGGRGGAGVRKLGREPVGYVICKDHIDQQKMLIQ